MSPSWASSSGRLSGRGARRNEQGPSWGYHRGRKLSQVTRHRARWRHTWWRREVRPCLETPTRNRRQRPGPRPGSTPTPSPAGGRSYSPRPTTRRQNLRRRSRYRHRRARQPPKSQRQSPKGRPYWTWTGSLGCGRRSCSHPTTHRRNPRRKSQHQRRRARQPPSSAVTTSHCCGPSSASRRTTWWGNAQRVSRRQRPQRGLGKTGGRARSPDARTNPHPGAKSRPARARPHFARSSRPARPKPRSRLHWSKTNRTHLAKRILHIDDVAVGGAHRGAGDANEVEPPAEAAAVYVGPSSTESTPRNAYADTEHRAGE